MSDTIIIQAPPMPSEEEMSKRRAAARAFGYGLSAFLMVIIPFCMQLFFGFIRFIPVIGFIFSYIDLLLGLYYFIMYVMALVFAIIALVNAKKGKGYGRVKAGKGFAITAIVLLGVGLLLSIAIIVLTVMLLVGGGILAVIFFVLMALLGSTQGTGSLALLALL